MRKFVTEWELPRGIFRVEWKVIEKRKYWRVEGSNGEFFPISKEEAPKFNDVVEILKHIYDEDVKKEWEKIEGGGVDD